MKISPIAYIQEVHPSVPIDKNTLIGTSKFPVYQLGVLAGSFSLSPLPIITNATTLNYDTNRYSSFIYSKGIDTIWTLFVIQDDKVIALERNLKLEKEDEIARLYIQKGELIRVSNEFFQLYDSTYPEYSIFNLYFSQLGGSTTT